MSRLWQKKLIPGLKNVNAADAGQDLLPGVVGV
jgi:hypothetical protein